MQDKKLNDALSQIGVAMDALRKAAVPVGESRPLFREVFAACLLLRWIDLQDAEQEAMSIFEGRSYQSLLPERLQWRHWASLDQPQAIADRLHEVARYVEDLHGDSAHPAATYLHALAEPLRRVLKIEYDFLQTIVELVADLPFETPGERRSLLDLFDMAITEPRDTYDGQHSTPADIARLVAAIANPQPGERVYDPCFGLGTLLVAAWQQAERARGGSGRPGALLDVAGIEINAGAFLIGLTRMLLAGIDAPRLEPGNSLERESPGSPGRHGFDVIVANPPIGAKLNRVPSFYKHFPIPTRDSTGLFIQHTLSQLKPYGRAVIAVPEGFLFRGGAERELRRHLLVEGQVEAVIGLPPGALAPRTNVKCSLLVLAKQGGAGRVRMVDATPLFEHRSGSKFPELTDEIAEFLATELRRPELRRPIKGSEENTPDRGVLSRFSWELSIGDLEAIDWDLSPRRREKGGLDELLSRLNESLGETGSVVPLSEVAEVMAGRPVRSSDLLNEPPLERAVGYVRIRDLSEGKVRRTSSWLRSGLASDEQRSTLLPGDVLLSRSGTIGKAAVVRNGAIGAVAGNGIYVLRVDRERLDAGFLLAYLGSAACKNWLTAQSRGASIQHLSRAVLDELPVPLPPLQMQARAAEQFRDFGTDVLAFLAQATGDQSDGLTLWLEKLDQLTPKVAAGLGEAPALSQIEPLAEMADRARNWLAHAPASNSVARWLLPLTEALVPLVGVTKIPPGPSLLSVLQDAERGLLAVIERAPGHLPAESQGRVLAERLHEWLRAVVTTLVDAAGLRVSDAPASLVAGSFAEFSVDLVNIGALPLRGVLVKTVPDWGVAEVPYLAERGALTLNLRGDVPKQGNRLSLQLRWQARNLSGHPVSGDVELVVRLSKPEEVSRIQKADLGGSPYVTGSPLEPHHGQDVFFGREHLIEQISRQIATHGNVVLLEGNRRAGKTSILKHLEGRTVIPGWLAVYSSLQGADGAVGAVGVPTADIFRAVARSIATALTKLGIEAPLPNGQVIAAGKPALGVARACREGIGSETSFSDFRDYIELVLSVLEPIGLGLVLMLDEFDKLQEGIDSGVTSPQVPENIRFLIQTYPKVSAILTGSRRLKRLREEYWSALYGLGTSIPVTTLDVESARSVVTKPVEDKLAYSNEAVERVLELTARHPYLMQCLCNRVFQYAVETRTRSITLSTVDSEARGLVRDNEHFASLWDYAGLGPETGRLRRQLILLICAQKFKQGADISFGTLQEELMQAGVGNEVESLDADLAYLRELELVEFSGDIGDGQYRLAIPLMADWIKQQQDADVVVSRARTEAEEENG